MELTSSGQSLWDFGEQIHTFSHCGWCWKACRGWQALLPFPEKKSRHSPKVSVWEAFRFPDGNELGKVGYQAVIKAGQMIQAELSWDIWEALQQWSHTTTNFGLIPGQKPFCEGILSEIPSSAEHSDSPAGLNLAWQGYREWEGRPSDSTSRGGHTTCVLEVGRMVPFPKLRSLFNIWDSTMSFFRKRVPPVSLLGSASWLLYITQAWQICVASSWRTRLVQ